MFKKNNNTLIIAAIIGFIFAWQFFVIAPKQKKTNQNIESTNSIQNIEKNSNTIVGVDKNASSSKQNLSNNNVSPEANLVVQSQPQSQKLKNFYLRDNRYFSVNTLGGINNFTLQDYKPRTKSENQYVSFLNPGLSWVSDNRLLQSCLNGLTVKDQTKQNIKFSNKTTAGSCSVLLSLKDEDIFSYNLIISGFQNQAGNVYLRGEGLVDKSIPADEQFRLGYKVDDSIDWISDKKLSKKLSITGTVNWLSWGDKYFTFIAIPQGNLNPSISHGGFVTDSNKTFYSFRYPLSTAELNGIQEVSTKIYLGTRSPDILKLKLPEASDAYHFGFLSVLAKWIIFVLNKINLLTNNYGLAIIVLTIIIKLLFWPLNKKVYVSGLRMKAVQPQMNKIKEKYGKDKEKAFEMNKEVMALYKKHKVNPMGSCLPLLLQMPVFFALFGALRNSIELYQAPFIGWLQDLSSPDPYFILPVLWTVSLMLTMALNPQTQQKQPGMPDMKWMFYGMNILFGFLSKDWPSGLLIYLIVTNVLSLIQQTTLRKSESLKPVIQEGV